ncbi:MAG TPA: hypothetical protein VMV82_09085 [Candidatus Dormibacteraeota bacterium]|nr:hypothetical protein [Candidatus Dormibacteraeota bacterium]
MLQRSLRRRSAMPLFGILAVVLLSASVYLATQLRRRGSTREAVAVALAPPAVRWTKEIAGDDTPTPQARIAIVERLGLLANGWSVALLEEALDDEYDAAVREAAWRALLRARADEATSSRST